MKKDDLAREAAAKAIRLRKAFGFKPNEVFCVFDFAQEKLGLEVQFIEAPSMEGMYYKAKNPRIILGSQRPQPRQRLTCAHEIGHDAFGHGTRVDELVESQQSGFQPEEFSADRFGQIFLMPSPLVGNAFNMRGLRPETASPIEIFTVSNWIGVGYSTLINHTCYSLRLLSERRAKELLRYSPKDIRGEILGRDEPATLWVVNAHWIGRPVDVHVGDIVQFPPDTTVEKQLLVEIDPGSSSAYFQATAPGVSRYFLPNGIANFVRVSRKDYVGLSRFRHEEDVE